MSTGGHCKTMALFSASVVASVDVNPKGQLGCAMTVDGIVGSCVTLLVTNSLYLTMLYLAGEISMALF